MAAGMALMAALTIAGLPLQEGPSELHADRQDAEETVVPSDPPRPGAATPPPTEWTTVVVRTPTSATVAEGDLPSVTTSRPPSDTVVVETPTLAPPTQEYVLDIQSIDLHEPVVAGDQDEIDQGHVTAVDWSSEGYPTSCPPGDGCTVWLAGHRSTHQAVFARLPEITAGTPDRDPLPWPVLHLHGHRRGHRARIVSAVGDPR